jgi:acyl-CoA synthetase (AMP-forming)/AMP-acid ligase II
MHRPLLVTEFLDRARDHYADREAVVGADGTRHSYAEVGERADGFAAALQARGIEKGDRVAVLDPNTRYHLTAAYGIMQRGAIHNAITGMGGRHVCTRGVDAASVFETIVAEDVSYLCAAPTVLNTLLDYYEAHDPATTGDAPVRCATAGSAPPEATIRTVEDEFGWYLKHVYGATETGPLITTSDARRLFEDGSEERFAVKKRQGLGFLGTELRVVDEDGADVARDDETVGEVVVRGNQVMEEYWNAPEATEAAFSDRIEGYYSSV